MPKYRVYIDQIVQYYRDIEAGSMGDAESAAEGCATASLVEYNRMEMEIREDLTEEIPEIGEG